MTTQDKVARRKLTLLELAVELGNVSKACQLSGYSRLILGECFLDKLKLDSVCNFVKIHKNPSSSSM